MPSGPEHMTYKTIQLMCGQSVGDTLLIIHYFKNNE